MPVSDHRVGTILKSHRYYCAFHQSSLVRPRHLIRQPQKRRVPYRFSYRQSSDEAVVLRHICHFQFKHVTPTGKHRQNKTTKHNLNFLLSSPLTGAARTNSGHWSPSHCISLSLSYPSLAGIITFTRSSHPLGRKFSSRPLLLLCT